MKQAIYVLAAALAMSCFTVAQQNPVMESVRQIMQRQEKNLTAAAEEMPPDKYGFRPTSQQMTFGTLVMHVAESNEFLCSKLSGTSAAKSQIQATDSKAKLVSAEIDPEHKVLLDKDVFNNSIVIEPNTAAKRKLAGYWMLLTQYFAQFLAWLV